MIMKVSVNNNSGIPYTQYGTDSQKEQATNFVNADNKDVNRMTAAVYQKKYSNSDKSFAKGVSNMIKATPLIAVASSLALGRGKKASLFSGLTWGLALAAPILVDKVNNKATQVAPSIEKAEKKHPLTTFVTSMVASVGAYMGMTSLAAKAISSPKLGAHPKVTKFVGNLSKKLGNMKKEITKKAPQEMLDTMKSVYKDIKKNKTVVKVAKNVLEHAPMLTILGAGAALIAKSVQASSRSVYIKSNIKDKQMNVAKDLVNAYSMENESLKEANQNAGEQIATLTDTSSFDNSEED